MTMKNARGHVFPKNSKGLILAGGATPRGAVEAGDLHPLWGQQRAPGLPGDAHSRDAGCARAHNKEVGGQQGWREATSLSSLSRSPLCAHARGHQPGARGNGENTTVPGLPGPTRRRADGVGRDPRGLAGTAAEGEGGLPLALANPPVVTDGDGGHSDVDDKGGNDG